MRYHIDTIPVWDAMKLEGECPLCALRRKVELSEADRYLGASVMEPDTRIAVNEKGFCQKHQQMLFAAQNRLGHALMLQTHLRETQHRLDKPLHALRKAARTYGETSMLDRMTAKGQSAKKDMADAAATIAALSHTCILCDSVEESMKRYLHTFFHLYKTDAEFRTRLADSKGFCLPDTALLIAAAPEELSAKETAAFTELILDLTEKNLTRTQEDIDWFIKKYDYRFDGEPWKNSRDAVERTVNKLRGWCIGQEPNPQK